jgi:dienelactone hydrolase
MTPEAGDARLAPVRTGSKTRVTVAASGVALAADLAVPEAPKGIVLFAHGSGSSRRSPRNRQVADALQDAGYATVLMDLLTTDEEEVDLRTRELRFDIPLLASRLTGAVDWLAEVPALGGLPVATFGASTGAAAAIITAADRPGAVHAVISRGGRPDLAGEALDRLRAPCLLIVGGNDPAVLELNGEAAERLGDVAVVEVVAGATHLFEEPGTLERVVDLTIAHLRRHLT